METRNSSLMKSRFTAKEDSHWRGVILKGIRKGHMSVTMESMPDGRLFTGDRLNKNREKAFKEWLMENDLYYHERCWSLEIYTFHGLVTKSCNERTNICYNTVTNEVKYEGSWWGEENWEYV